MSVLNSLQMNLLEAATAAGFKDRMSYLAPIEQENDFLRVAAWVASTDGKVNKVTQVAELGSGAWAKVNAPIPEIGSKSETVVETLKIFEGLSSVDTRLLTGKNKVKVRDAQDIANLEGFIQSFLGGFLYNTETKDGCQGIFSRRGKLSVKGTVGAGGTASGSLTSALLVEFGPRGLEMVYEDGEQPGITATDKGEVFTDGHYVLQRLYHIEAGIAIHKQLGVQRLCNIDPTKALDVKAFIRMRNQLPSMGRNAVLFVNRDVKSLIEEACFEKTNATYTYSELQGYGPVAKVLGIPVMMLEAIRSDEAVVA